MRQVAGAECSNVRECSYSRLWGSRRKLERPICGISQLREECTKPDRESHRDEDVGDARIIFSRLFKGFVVHRVYRSRFNCGLWYFCPV